MMNIPLMTFIIYQRNIPRDNLSAQLLSKITNENTQK